MGAKDKAGGHVYGARQHSLTVGPCTQTCVPDAWPQVQGAHYSRNTVGTQAGTTSLNAAHMIDIRSRRQARQAHRRAYF